LSSFALLIRLGRSRLFVRWGPHTTPQKFFVIFPASPASAHAPDIPEHLEVSVWTADGLYSTPRRSSVSTLFMIFFFSPGRGSLRTSGSFWQNLAMLDGHKNLGPLFVSKGLLPLFYCFLFQQLPLQLFHSVRIDIKDFRLFSTRIEFLHCLDFLSPCPTPSLPFVTTLSFFAYFDRYLTW